MYNLDIYSGEVTRISDKKIIAPCDDFNDVDFQAYVTWCKEGNKPTIIDDTLIKTKQEAVWDLIQAEREKRKYAGVKVGDNWFHSDDASRIQFIGLFTKKDNFPTDVYWKTLTKEGGLFDPVLIPLTYEIAEGYINAISKNDLAMHAAAEVHRSNMLKLEDPFTYDYSGNWPESFLDI